MFDSFFPSQISVISTLLFFLRDDHFHSSELAVCVSYRLHALFIPMCTLTISKGETLVALRYCDRKQVHFVFTSDIISTWFLPSEFYSQSDFRKWIIANKDLESGWMSSCKIVKTLIKLQYIKLNENEIDHKKCIALYFDNGLNISHQKGVTL